MESCSILAKLGSARRRHYIVAALTSLLNSGVQNVAGYLQSLVIQETWESNQSHQSHESQIAWWLVQSAGFRVSTDHRIDWTHPRSFLLRT